MSWLPGPAVTVDPALHPARLTSIIIATAVTPEINASFLFIIILLISLSE
jgi:hypothetical protein